jgi:signal transduction histidine kinase
MDENKLDTLQKPEWLRVSFDKHYVVTYKILKTRILLCQAEGYCSLIGVKKALLFSDKIIKENFSDGFFIYVENFSKLNGISNDARRFYISRMQKQNKMIALIYYNVSSMFRLSIKLAKRLSIIDFEVFISSNLEETVNICTKLFEKYNISPENESGKIKKIFQFKSAGRAIRKSLTSGLLYQSDNYSVSYNIIDDNILHTIAKGLLSIDDVVPNVQEVRRLIESTWGPGKPFYFISGVEEIKVTRESRKLYLAEILKLYEEFPFKMYVFYGANWLIRTAINMSKHTVSFPVKIEKNLGNVLKLIFRDKNTSNPIFSRLRNRKGKMIPEENIRRDIDHLMGFLGSIDWAEGGIKTELKSEQSSLFSPIYDGLAMIKMELDELYEERKLAEEQRADLQKKLEHSLKMEAVGTVAGGVAHDLNNILGSMVSYPEILLMEMPKDSHLRGYVKSIYKSGIKAATIVQDLLTLTRRGVAVSEPVNLNDVIQDYLFSLEFKKMKMFHPGVKFENDLVDDLKIINGSSVHLQKTIMNLVSNAAEAMPDGGMVKISTRNWSRHNNDGSGYAMVRVSDTGIGIPEEDLDRIFEPFFTKKKMGRSGTGLGMAVVWNTVHDHNGFIDVKSGLNKGTTFILYFPVSQTLSLPQKKKSNFDSLTGQGETILVVDDVLEQREVASAILMKLGYNVDSVGSGEEAVEYVADKPVDLLLLDMLMDPGIDGLETYKRLLILNPDQKAIIASGYSEPETMQEVTRLGSVKYLKKPYTIRQIGLVVKAILESVD